MSFIIQKAVESLLIDKAQAKALAEIVLATPNADYAVSLLFGVYKEPLIHGRKFGKNKEKYQFESYSPWDDRVHYSYSRNKTIGIYISKDTNEEEVTYENYKSFEKHYNDKDIKHMIIKFPETEKGTAVMGLDSWNKLQSDYTMEEVYLNDVLENPEEYGLI